jgi:hypothetical protein
MIFLQNSTELNKKAAQSTNNIIKIKNVIIFAKGNKKVGVMDRQDRKPPRSQLDEPANDNGELILFVEALHLYALGCSGCLLVIKRALSCLCLCVC